MMQTQRRVDVMSKHLLEDVPLEREPTASIPKTAPSKLLQKPYSTGDMRELIKVARKNKQRIRIVSEYGSMYPQYMQISLENFKTCTFIHCDKKYVTVEPGISLEEINTELSEFKMTMKNECADSNVTVYQLLETAYHGSSKIQSILSTQVLEIDLLIATGEILKLSRENHTDVFMAALCNLGSLGVPVSVTLAIEKQFILHSIQRSMKLEYVLKQNLVETEGNIKIWWFPHSRNCISWRANKIVLNEKLQPHNLADLYAIAKNKLVIRTILQILHYFSVFVPKLIPMINICYFYLFYHREKQTTDYAHKIFTLSNLGQEKITTEWAIPMQNVELAVKTLKDLFLKENLKVQFPIELSYSKGDDVYLSPSFGRDTCWIAIHCFIPYGKIPTTKSIFVGFEKVMKYFGGRPSWRNDQIDTEKIEVSYPLLTDFKRIRDKLDPERLFFTELVEKIY